MGCYTLDKEEGIQAQDCLDKFKYTPDEYRGRMAKPEFNISEKQFYVADYNWAGLLNLGLDPDLLPSVLTLCSSIRRITTFKDSITKVFSFAHIHKMALRYTLTNCRRGASGLVNFLISLGLLETDGSYQVGVKSRGYRIGPVLRDLSWRPAEYSEILESLPIKIKTKHRTLWHKASQYFTSSLENAPAEVKESAIIIDKNLKKTYITLSFKLKDILMDASIVKHAQNMAKKKESWSAEKIMDGYMESIRAFNDGEFFTTYDPTTGRVFTNITNMKKEIRKCLFADGEKLVSVDLKSCQPVLLSILYNDSIAEHAAEKEKFTKIVSENDIYNYLSGPDVPRSEAKVGMFILMFAKPWSHKGAAWDKFSTEFPILAGLITETKKKFGYKHLSRLMQQKEASIMISCVMQELHDRGIYGLSCHDSVICKPGDLETVKEIINRHFYNHMGFLPVLVED